MIVDNQLQKYSLSRMNTYPGELSENARTVNQIMEKIKLIQNQEKLNSLSGKIKELKTLSRYIDNEKDKTSEEDSEEKSVIEAEFKRQASSLKKLIAEYRRESKKVSEPGKGYNIDLSV